MSYMLRTVRKSRWYLSNSGEWLDKDDLPADILNDLITSSNTLSIWEIDGNKNNLERLLAALAASREHINQLDYVLFSPEILNQVDVKTVKTKGELLDPVANEWHVDITDLTAMKLIALAKAIVHSPITEKIRHPEKSIKLLVAQAVANDHFPIDSLKDKVRIDIKQYLNISLQENECSSCKGKGVTLS